MRALAIDVGTSSVRTGVVEPSGAVTHVHQGRLSISTPQPGEVELDALEIGALVRDLASRTLRDAGPCEVLGVTNQRATTVVFDPDSGTPVGPALGWQDLRTVLDCLTLQSEGLRLAPNQSATKIKWLVEHSGRTAEELRFATLETWITWLLSDRGSFVTDRSNAAVTGLVNANADAWDHEALTVLGIAPVMLAQIVDTMGAHATATALEGQPQITALVGDQPASLFGQSRVTSGAKVTFGTGAMLDMVRGSQGPPTMTRFDSGCFPVVVRSQHGVATWGLEGIVLAAGACVEWLRDELGLIGHADECESLAASIPSCDGVSFVPALSGLGTPYWDFGARGAFFGLTRGSTRAHLVRAVLEGIAHRGADLVDAAEAESMVELDEIRVDGGMSTNQLFVQMFADFTGRLVTVSSEREATTRGAGLMALVGGGHLSLGEVESLWKPAQRFTPRLSPDERVAVRAQWRESVARAAKTIPELSAVTF
ncbi:MAG TPA: FGGY-family carbohydrate kinase [Acidimicrobiales bacterium]|nr:FGGY-family carbohydrate kinase [Acidimicrobiales bacterium]